MHFSLDAMGVFFFNFYFLNFFSSFKLSLMCLYSNTEITPNKLQKREIGKEEGRKSREVGGRRMGQRPPQSGASPATSDKPEEEKLFNSHLRN